MSDALTQAVRGRLSEREFRHHGLRQQLYKKLAALDCILEEEGGTYTLEAELARLQVLNVARDIRALGC